MKRILLGVVSSVLISTSLSAQEPLVEIIFGPRDGDNAGTLYAYPDSAIEVDVWVKTVPGRSIIGFHFPLSSKDEFVESRNGIDYDYPPLNSWISVAVLSPNDDPNHDGYTNQSLWGICCWGVPDYRQGLHTEGEWWKIASFLMTTVNDPGLNTPFCDAFIEGWDTYNDGLVLAEYAIGELDPSTYTVEYSCLQFGPSPCESYIVGDFNGSGEFNVADIITSYSRLATGLPEAGIICECPPGSGHSWAAAMDVNNSCVFNIADVIIAYQRLALGEPELIPCGQCPPGP